MGGCGNAGPALTPVEGGCEPGGPVRRLLLYITGTCECNTEEQNGKGILICNDDFWCKETVFIFFHNFDLVETFRISH